MKLREKLWDLLTPVLIWTFMLLVAANALYACAHVASTASACEPTAAQMTQLLTAASNPDELVSLALIDALTFSECVIKKGADEFIASHQPPAAAAADAGSVTADLAQSASVDAIRLRNLMDWRAEHP